MKHQVDAQKPAISVRTEAIRRVLSMAPEDWAVAAAEGSGRCPKNLPRQ
jgi:hypothetical protein